jgi:hypothetical protein
VSQPTSTDEPPPMAEKPPGIAGAVVVTIPAITPAIAPVQTATPPAPVPARPVARAPAVIMPVRKSRPRAVERDYERPPIHAIAPRSHVAAPEPRVAPVRRHRYRESQFPREVGPTLSRRRRAPRDSFAQPYDQPYAQPWGRW